MQHKVIFMFTVAKVYQEGHLANTTQNYPVTETWHGEGQELMSVRWYLKAGLLIWTPFCHLLPLSTDRPKALLLTKKIWCSDGMPFPYWVMRTHNMQFQLATHLLPSCFRSSHEVNCFESFHVKKPEFPNSKRTQEGIPLWMTGILLFEYPESFYQSYLLIYLSVQLIYCLFFWTQGLTREPRLTSNSQWSSLPRLGPYVWATMTVWGPIFRFLNFIFKFAA